MRQFKQLCDKFAPNWEILDSDYSPAKEFNIKCKRCGAIRKSFAQKLRNGNVVCQSCKSKRKSAPEVCIENFLNQSNIEYIFQKRFPDLKGKRQQPLRIDFFIPSFHLYIEYDGEGHFNENYFRNNGVLDHTNDIKKQKYCDNNKLKLIRIPYHIKQDLQEFLEFLFEELRDFNRVITNNYYGKEYSYLEV